MRDHGIYFLEYQWPQHDVCIIAGDLSSSKHLVQSIKICAEVFPEIVYVPGNHEYYGSSICEVKDLLHNINISNFHYLDNNHITINNQRFIGGTMWFPLEKDTSRRNCVNDFDCIKDYHNIYIENESFQKLIPEILHDDVVVTHHLPSNKSIPLKYKSDLLNCYFVNDVENHIIYYSPKLWIHGHTHSNMSYMIGETNVICNPLGYPYENGLFNYECIVDL